MHTFLIEIFLTEVRKQICPENACGEGECVLTAHPKYQYACKCKDGSYKFEPCTCKCES